MSVPTLPGGMFDPKIARIEPNWIVVISDCRGIFCDLELSLETKQSDYRICVL